jgi:TatD DNase family protein
MTSSEVSSAIAHIQLIDTHAHIADRRLIVQIDDVLSRAKAEGVVQVVAIATTLADSPSVIALAQNHPGVFATVGIHPNDAVEAGPTDWNQIVQLARSPGVVGIGETGLDRYWDKTPFVLQQEYFGRHLDLANELDLPVVIHCRDCETDILEQLQSLRRPVKGILHSFTGNWSQAQAFLEVGLHISFAGMLTFANRTLDALREAAANVPIDRLLVETDSPYLTPHPFRGKLNEPGRVSLTAARLGELRGMNLAQIGQVTTKNAQALFRLPPSHVLV